MVEARPLSAAEKRRIQSGVKRWVDTRSARGADAASNAEFRAYLASLKASGVTWPALSEATGWNATHVRRQVAAASSPGRARGSRPVSAARASSGSAAHRSLTGMERKELRQQYRRLPLIAGGRRSWQNPEGAALADALTMLAKSDPGVKPADLADAIGVSRSAVVQAISASHATASSPRTTPSTRHRPLTGAERRSLVRQYKALPEYRESKKWWKGEDGAALLDEIRGLLADTPPVSLAELGRALGLVPSGLARLLDSYPAGTVPQSPAAHATISGYRELTKSEASAIRRAYRALPTSPDGRRSWHNDAGEELAGMILELQSGPTVVAVARIAVVLGVTPQTLAKVIGDYDRSLAAAKELTRADRAELRALARDLPRNPAGGVAWSDRGAKKMARVLKRHVKAGITWRVLEQAAGVPYPILAQYTRAL